MENINPNIQQLIDRIDAQDLEIKKLKKSIKELNHIVDHNTEIINRDLTKVEEDVSKIYNKYISKKGNKRPREIESNENKNEN
jgi:uncharacterized protein YoxC